jgi:hypothetical protein
MASGSANSFSSDLNVITLSFLHEAVVSKQNMPAVITINGILFFIEYALGLKLLIRAKYLNCTRDIKQL